MSERELKDRNQNPWYILMTLHGEQEGDRVDWKLAAQNRKLWNAWACQGMAQEERHAIADKIEIDRSETVWSDTVAKEVAELFQKEWLRRNAVDVNQPDIPYIETGFVLNEVDFSNMVVLRAFIFRAAFFSGSHFGKMTDFCNAHFGESTDFRDAHFGEWTDFSGAHFGKSTSFSGARFGETTYFSGARFGETTYFSGAHFGETTYFSGAQFKRFCYFTYCHFGSRVDAYHLGDRVDARHCAPNFANVVFGGPTSFENATFASHLPVLSGTTLNDTTTLTATRSHWPVMGPGVLSKLDIFLRLKSPPKPSMQQDPAEAKAAAAKLRHVMAKQALPEEEHFFFRREMHHAARAAPFWRTAHIYLYEAVSSFGYSIMRPAVLLAMLWAIGTFIYATQTALGWTTAAAYSFSVMFKFFGFQRTYLAEETKLLTPVMETISAGQTVFAFILLFFLGLGLRTRFRLR